LVEQDEIGDVVELSVGTVGVLSSRVGRRGHLLDLTFPDQHPPTARTLRTTSTLGTPSALGTTTTLGSTTTAGPTGPGPGPSGGGATARAHAVVGPSGSGRSTAATGIAGPDALHVRLAEADSADAAWRELVVPALRGLGVQSTPLVLDDIDLLDDADLRRLAARLGSAGAGLVVVTSREDPRAAVTEALDACGARTVLRPLHERGAESAEIVRRMVAELATERGLGKASVTVRFADAVCALDMPNGLVSLRSVLGECLAEAARRGSATLDVDSLPTRARSARAPRAGELARGEYDAIVAALADCDGVRSRAAKRLGISRTTLYARMREFGLS
ncbi:MAG: helix-turn-helix domain-containing protein, partial [Dietzia sp.]